MEIYTIGFTQKSAAEFFETLKKRRIQRLIDVRLNNSSQLSGFSKKNDLKYFLETICGAEYLHMPDLAPTQLMRDQFRSSKLTWQEYAQQYIDLLQQRRIEEVLDRSLFKQRSVFLCTEPKQSDCHRGLLVDYLNEHWGNITSIPL